MPTFADRHQPQSLTDSNNRQLSSRQSPPSTDSSVPLDARRTACRTGRQAGVFPAPVPVRLARLVGSGGLPAVCRFDGWRDPLQQAIIIIIIIII